MSVASQAAGGYTLKRVQEMLGLSRTVVTGLVAAGFVSPARGPRNEYRFGFHDLLLLRTAHSLQRARIPPRRIFGALRELAATLPEDLPLTGLRITAVGTEVTVHDRDGRWNPETGQVLLDFDVAPVDGTLAFLPRPIEPDAAAAPDADAWFRQAQAAEDADPAEAERLYRRAIDLAAGHEQAHVNLGALLCESGRCEEAVVLYARALAAGASSAVLHFNHALALEDTGLVHRAVESYQRALQQDPALEDAHYNLGMLLERLGDGQGGLRHFSAYRRLARP